MKKKVLLILLAVLAGAMIWLALLFRPQYAASQSVRLVTPGMYTLTYEGDYGFDDFLAQGGASSTAEVASYVGSFLTHGLVKVVPDPQTFGCSSLTVRNANGETLSGRNFDWPEGSSDIVVVRTCPKRGYASLSTTPIMFLGFGQEWKPARMMDRMMLLSSIYVPLDGINECGLYVADLVAGDTLKTDQQTSRPDLTTTTAIRLLLDKAATVDEALTLLGQYDMHSDIQFAHHLAISDRTGRSVVVEWVDGEMLVADTPLCTNHYLAESNRKGTSLFLENSVQRYECLERQLETHPQMDEEKVTDSMAAVAGSDYTIWSVVFNLHQLTATYYLRADFTHPFTFSVGGDE